MAIYVSCRCGQSFSAELFLAGTTLPCPYCGHPLQIPGASPPVIATFQSPPHKPSPRRPAIDRSVVVAAGIAGGAAVLLLVAVAIATLTSARPAAEKRPVAANQPMAKGTRRGPPPAAMPPPAPPAAPATEPAAKSTPVPETPALPSPLTVLGKAFQGEGWQDKLVIAGGIYEMDSPNSIWIAEVYEPGGVYGPTIQGGAYVDSGCKITWAVILKEFDPTIGPINNPKARLRTIADMQGIETRDKHGAHDRVQIAIKHSDHMLWLTLDGRPGTVDSAATEKIVSTLRRVKTAEAGLAAFQAQQGQPRP